MIPVLLVVCIIVWVNMQFRQARRPVWDRRLAATLPVLRHIAADVRAVRTDIRIWRFTRRVK